MVADVCLGMGEPLVLAGQREDLGAALVVFAARQAHPDHEILWLGPDEPHELWRRFLQNAAIGRADRSAIAPLAIDPIVCQLTPKVMERCVSGAHRLSHVIPAVIVRDGLATL